MSELANNVTVQVTRGIIEVVDNNKNRNIIEIQDGTPTIVSATPVHEKVVSTVTNKVRIVEIKSPGPQGVQGPIGPSGSAGPSGSQGPAGGGVESVTDNGDGTLTLLFVNGFSHTTPDLSGPSGSQGVQGIQGETGDAFQFSDFTSEQLASFEGDDGDKGDKGDKGDQGDSAYQVWLNQGNTGTAQDFLDSLKGDKGDQGDAGPSGSFDGEVLATGVLANDLTAQLWTSYSTATSVGGISHNETFPAGTPIETILRELLIKPRPNPPTPSSTVTLDDFRNNGVTINYTREIGTYTTIDAVAFTKTQSPTIGGVYSDGATSDFSLIDVGNTSPASFTEQSVRRTSNGSLELYLTHTTTAGSGQSSKTVTYKSYNYMGGYTDITVTAENVQDLVDSIKNQRKSLTTGKAWSPSGNSTTETANKFTYIVYPSTYGNISSITDANGFPITDTFIKVASSLPVKNFSETPGFTYNVHVYKSEEDQQLADGDQIFIV